MAMMLMMAPSLQFSAEQHCMTVVGLEIVLFCVQFPQFTQARHQEAALQQLVELFKAKEESEEAMRLAEKVCYLHNMNHMTLAHITHA